MNRAHISRGNLSALRRSGFAVAIAALSAAPALAANGTWIQGGAATYNYGDPANWLNGTVAGGADALADFSTVDVNGIVVVNLAADPTLGSLTFGDSNISTAGGYQLTGSTLTLAGAAPTITTNALAAGSVARIDNILAGTAGYTITGAGRLQLTNASTVTGNIKLSNGNVIMGGQQTTATPPTDVFTLLGAAGATLTLDGTNTLTNGYSRTSATAMEIQQNVVVNAGSTTTINAGNRFRFGQTGTARTVTGSGTLNINLQSYQSRDDLTANFTAFTGNINFTAQQVLGADGVTMVSPVGRMLVNGGQFGAGFTSAKVALNDFAVLLANTNSGGNTINFGELSGNSTNAGFLAPTSGGAATFSVGGLNTNASFAGLFVGNNNLTKVGTGVWTLTTSQDLHTGVVNVNAGTLALSGSGALPTAPTITLANGATLDVSGYTNGVYSTGVGAGAGQTVQSASGSIATIAGNYHHGQGVLQPGTLTGAGRLNFSGNLTLDGGTLNMELSPNLAPGGTNDLISVSGVTSLGGGVTLNLGLLGGLTTGPYTLIQSAGGFSGGIGGWTINFGGRGAAPTVSVVGNNLVANVSSVAGINLTWTGGTNGNWDVNSTPNFKNSSTNGVEKFFQLDSVRFDDTSAVNAVSITASVAPNAVVVDNSAVNYTFNGSGAIVGGGSLTKRGTGTLTIANTGVNSYGGGTTIEAGTLDIGALGQNGIGTGTITLAGGTLRAITPSGSNVTLANAINVTGNATLVTSNTTNARQTILGGAVTGSGSLTVTNDNTASLKGIDIANTSGFTGTLTINDALAARFSSATNGNATMNLVINGTGSVGTISASALTIPLRTLSGNGRLQGHQSSGTGSTVEYQIGGVNASSTFDGVVANGATGTGGTIPLAVHITKTGTGTLTLNGLNTYTGTTAVQAGTLVLGANATAPVLGATTATTTGGADIRGGKLVLGYTTGNSPALQVRTILAAGYGEPTKFLTGQIRSSQLPASGRTLGYKDNAATSTLTIAYTIPGDADLSFDVGFDDLVALAQNYNLSNRVWEHGDFDYDSDVDFDDLVTLAQNYNLSLTAGQLNSLGSDFAADWALAQSLVPEPTSLAALGGLATLVLRRRR